jgi:hypothetical protein
MTLSISSQRDTMEKVGDEPSDARSGKMSQGLLSVSDCLAYVES